MVTRDTSIVLLACVSPRLQDKDATLATLIYAEQLVEGTHTSSTTSHISLSAWSDEEEKEEEMEEEEEEDSSDNEVNLTKKI